MTSNRINLIIAVGLILALVGLCAANGLLFFLHGQFDANITMAILTVLGLLQAYRHTADVVSANGSGGVSSPPAK